MAAKPELSIRAAVINCIARCSESEAPLFTIGEFLGNLSRLGWTGQDIRIVEMNVLYIFGNFQEAQYERHMTK
jgi:hypothetical protein